MNQSEARRIISYYKSKSSFKSKYITNNRQKYIYFRAILCLIMLNYMQVL